MSKMILVVVSIWLFLALMGCGGGGSSSGATVPSNKALGSTVYYGFEETAGSQAFNNAFNHLNGQIFCATRTEGRVGKALDFSTNSSSFVQFDLFEYSGENNEVFSKIHVDFPENRMSLAGWIFPKDLAAGQNYQIFGEYGGLRSSNLVLEDGYLTFTIFANQRDPMTIVTSKTRLTNNLWYHFAITYDGSEGTIYLDGTEDSRHSITIPIPEVIDTFYLGGVPGSAAFPGIIDEFLFTADAYSPKEVQSLYLNDVAVDPISPANEEYLYKIVGGGRFGPTAFYDFEEAGEATAFNILFNDLHGTIIGASRETGQVGKALDFSKNSSSHVLFDLSYVWDPLIGDGQRKVIFPTDSITLSAWIKPINIDTRQSYLLFGDGSSGIRSLKFSINQGHLEFFIWGRSVSTTVAMSESRINNGEWQHIAMTYDTNQVIFYINGKEDSRKEITFPISDIVNNFFIGGVPSSPGSSFPGVVDEFLISATAFTPQEIQAIYSAGISQ